MGQLAGRVALITGASKGVGRVMSRMFAGEGAAVICAARSRDLVEETAAMVKTDGGRAIALVGDVSTEPDVLRIVQAGVKAFGKLDILVNNAGDGGPTKPVQDYTVDDWFYTINSCLTSSYMCTRFAVPEMLKAGGGAIVNISSTARRRGGRPHRSRDRRPGAGEGRAGRGGAAAVRRAFAAQAHVDRRGHRVPGRLSV